MNYLSLVVDLRIQCSVAGNGPVSLADNRAEYQRLIQWIQQANTEIQGKYTNWKFLWRENSFDTEGDKSRYVADVDIPGNVRQYRQTTFRCNGERLIPIDWYSYDQKGDQTELTDYGAPTHCLVMPNNDIQLFPIPDKPYTITYEFYNTPQVLNEAEDVPWIPQTWHRAIVYRAMMMYANYENAPEINQAGIDGLSTLMPQLEADQLPMQQDMAMSNEYNIVVRAGDDFDTYDY